MDFAYDDEQVALRQAVAALLSRAYDAERRRTVVGADPGFDEKIWGQLAEMGLLGLPFAEEHGGVGWLLWAPSCNYWAAWQAWPAKTAQAASAIAAH